MLDYYCEIVRSCEIITICVTLHAPFAFQSEQHPFDQLISLLRLLFFILYFSDKNKQHCLATLAETLSFSVMGTLKAPPRLQIASQISILYDMYVKSIISSTAT